MCRGFAGIVRLLYFGAVVFTAAWLVVLLWRKFVALRQVNVIVETPERAQQVSALERAFRAEDDRDDSSSVDEGGLAD
ncbi:hypothetical protein [Synechococcus sp. NOUM97013]|uniref:hypothetical protein n=1 Tax=Synechococcus sp. NOUM97013 TaxID=1442555 RepID=UPI0021042B6B|nr:hypothetical protein [Synechococcus sp. NOUM97013]